MQHMKKSEAQKFENSSTCTVLEYALGDSDINGAVGVINGRYPEAGFVVNRVCKELVYVLAGSGSLATKETSTSLQQGDLAVIPPNEAYYFEGQALEIFMPCTPAWYPEQYEEVPE